MERNQSGLDSLSEILIDEIPQLFESSSNTNTQSSISQTGLTTINLRFYGGVKNVFNDKGPFVPRTGDQAESGIGNFDSKFEGGIGRFIFLGVEWRM